MSIPHLVAGALLGVAVVGTVRAVARVRRAAMRAEWTVIPSIRRSRSLAVHARVSDDVDTTLPPVVLVHGFGIGSSYFVPLAACLRDDVRVYAPDLPGHGPSESDVRPLTTRELASALAAWMDANRLRAAVLVGHSVGAQVVAEVAVQRPDLASGLVLIGPASDPEARTVVRQLDRAARGLPFERPGLAVCVALDYTRAGGRVLMAELRDLITYRIEDVLPKLTVPVRVVRGRWDQLVPQRWAETVARMANAPEPTVIRRWSHAVHYDDPDAVADVVLELVTEVAADVRQGRTQRRAREDTPAPALRSSARRKNA